MSEIESAVKDAGGPVVVAGRMGVTTQRVCNWVVRGVPIEYCRPFIAAVGHRLTVADLRPSDWWLIWPELVTDEHPVPTAGTGERAA